MKELLFRSILVGRLWRGLFITDHQQPPIRRLLDLLSRWLWQLPQTLGGLLTGMVYIVCGLQGGVSKVAYSRGATVVVTRRSGWGAVSQGFVIVGCSEIDASCWLFRHEYGHCLQSKAMGWAYYPRVGIPSIVGREYHSKKPVEQDANRRSMLFFDTPHRQWMRVAPSWYDYASWFIPVVGVICAGLLHIRADRMALAAIEAHGNHGGTSNSDGPILRRSMAGVCGIAMIGATLFMAGCSSDGGTTDYLLRARVDGQNKDAFLYRYRDPVAGLMHADSAIAIIIDSLPDYADGYLRACNNMAYNCYMLSDYANVDSCLAPCFDSVMSILNPENLEMEQLLAQLLKARVLQRQCYTADSYQILYDIDHNRRLWVRNKDNDLHDFALMEYYITSLTLNYFFRKGALDNVWHLLQEIEEVRPGLRCDFAQDVSLNYAMAHSYIKLCSTMDDASYMLKRALELCGENLNIISNRNAFDPYHLANVYQLVGLMLSDTLVPSKAWADNEALFRSVCELMEYRFGLPPYREGEDFVLLLFEESTTLFLQQADPYQRIGATVTVGDYALSVGDTALAHYYYRLALNDETFVDFMAPKFEQRLYVGLINSGAASSMEELSEWIHKERQISQLISRNESTDFLLQHELQEARNTNKMYAVLFSSIGLLALVLVVVLWLLVRKTKDLKRETLRLQEAKRRDVERIANVETCLSVLRHDINPFMSYLQNKSLPPDLKQEVLSRMARTFDNIKAWTNISLPAGLQFRASCFDLREVFDSLNVHVLNPAPQQLSIRFHTSAIRVWADRDLLMMLLRNLVGNAVQHTPQGSIDIRAELWDDDPRFVHITVADTGCGMSPQQVDELFRTDKKIVQRTDTLASGASGNGFGLILCRYIIKQHDDHTIRGCRIWAESVEGKGSTMHFIIAIDPQQVSATNLC